MGDMTAMCGLCARYPISWQSDNWHCRASGLTVSRVTKACSKQSDPGSSETEERTELVRSIMAEKQSRPLELLRHQGGVVYVVDCEQYTKIGHTYDAVPKRILSLMTGNPFDLTIYALLKGATETERLLHRQFKTSRHRNEWFLFSPDERARLAQMVVAFGGVVYDGTSAPNVTDLIHSLSTEDA